MRSAKALIGCEIVRSMAMATVLALLVALLGIHIFYGIMARMVPDGWISHQDMIPQPIEVCVVILLCGSALLVAAPIAIKLSRRVINPLNAVAEGARRIAEGDLSARAVSKGGTLIEGGDLVHNFNVMAERLERASSDNSRWNSMIAHELRTPMTIMRGRLQGLLDGVFKPDRQVLQGLIAQADNLSRLIDDLRTVTLLESGHLHLRLETVNIADIVRDALHLSMSMMEGDGFELRADLEDGNLLVDPSRLRQVITALLDNVRQHAIPGPVLVELHFAGDEVTIAVEDSGPGMDSELATIAFEPFRQSAASATKGGSGLGLAVISGIARAHGGTAFYDPISTGGRFVVRFPRVVCVPDKISDIPALVGL